MVEVGEGGKIGSLINSLIGRCEKEFRRMVLGENQISEDIAIVLNGKIVPFL
ncbi:MAG: hypothetical protein ACUVQ0_01550 [Thermoproteota archaeon]